MYLIFVSGLLELQIDLRYIFRNTWLTHGCVWYVSACSPAVWEAGGLGAPADRTAGAA